MAAAADPTGFSPFGQSPFNNVVSTPPVPSLSLSRTSNNSASSTTSPANVFAQMKSGTFASGNEQSEPQQAGGYLYIASLRFVFILSTGKYDALRVNRESYPCVLRATPVDRYDQLNQQGGLHRPLDGHPQTTTWDFKVDMRDFSTNLLDLNLTFFDLHYSYSRLALTDYWMEFTLIRTESNVNIR
jgi:hypothetical protein